MRVFPATAPAQELLDTKPDGIFFSNGPGDPAALPYVIKNAQDRCRADVPMFGICLGHQVLGQAMGGKTFKLKFGHRGANHPVKHLETGQVEITVAESRLRGGSDVAAERRRDHAPESVRQHGGRLAPSRAPVFCVQYHPEASPGPHDADYLFGSSSTRSKRGTWQRAPPC